MCTQVPGCPANPAADGAYFKRNNICKAHCSAAEIDLPGGPFRFCQQCHQLHHVSEFVGLRKSCRAGLSSHRQRSRLRKAGQLAIEAAAGHDSSSGSDTSGEEAETSEAQSKPRAQQQRQQQQQQPANTNQRQQQGQQGQQQERERQQSQPAGTLEPLGEPDGEHWLLPLDLPPLDQILHLPESHVPAWPDMHGMQGAHDMHGFMGLQADLTGPVSPAAAGSARPRTSDVFAGTLFAAMAADVRTGLDQQPFGTPACPSAAGGGGGSRVAAAGCAAQTAHQQRPQQQEQQGGCGGGSRLLAASTAPSGTPPRSTSSCCEMDVSTGQQQQELQWAVARSWQQLQLCSPYPAPASAALPTQPGSRSSVSTADRSKRARIGAVALPKAATGTADDSAGVQQTAAGGSDRSTAMRMLLSMLQDSPAADPEAELRMLLQSGHKKQQQQQQDRKRARVQQQKQQQPDMSVLGVPLNGCAPGTSVASTALTPDASRPPAFLSGGMPGLWHSSNAAAAPQASMQHQSTSSISSSARTLDRLSTVLSAVPKRQLALLRAALERAERPGAEPDLDSLLCKVTHMRSYPAARPQQLPPLQLRRAVSQTVSSSGPAYGASMGRSHSEDARLVAALRALQQDGMQLGKPLPQQPLLSDLLFDNLTGSSCSSAAGGSGSTQFQTGAGDQLAQVPTCDMDGFRPQPLLPAFPHQMQLQQQLQQQELLKRQLLKQRLEGALASAAIGGAQEV